MTQESQPLVETWWRTDGERSDQKMEEGHQQYWQHVLDELSDVDFKGKHILDFGCNQGGLLRALYQRQQFASGTGVDVACKSIEVAQSRTGALPLTYQATCSLLDHPEFRGKFDYAISTSVLYLVSDLPSVANQVSYALKPGGEYFADYADYEYASSPMMERLRKEISAKANINFQDYSLDTIASAFNDAGFEVSIKRFLPRGFIKLSIPDTWYESVRDRMDFEYHRTYMFRFKKRA